MRKYKCGECGAVVMDYELTEIMVTEEDTNEFSSIWRKCDYDLSLNQRIFCIDAENCGLEIDFSYSGRGMYGQKCPCVRVDYTSELDTTARVATDSMGNGVVIYARG